jgi:hypothetical protein
LPGPREPVIDEAAAGLGGGNQVANQVFAVGVLEFADVLALVLGFSRHQDIVVAGVEHEEVVVISIAQVTQRLFGGLFGVVFQQGTGRRQLLMVRQDADADLDDVAGLLFAIFQHGRLELEQGGKAKSQQACQG